MDEWRLALAGLLTFIGTHWFPETLLYEGTQLLGVCDRWVNHLLDPHVSDSSHGDEIPMTLVVLGCASRPHAPAHWQRDIEFF